MAKKPQSKSESAPPDEYDFRGGVRGKYSRRFAAGTNIVVLSPDVAKAFRTSEAVNQALRSLLKADSKADSSARPKTRKATPPKAR
jgi:hypothetical protein